MMNRMKSIFLVTTALLAGVSIAAAQGMSGAGGGASEKGMSAGSGGGMSQNAPGASRSEGMSQGRGGISRGWPG